MFRGNAWCWSAILITGRRTAPAKELPYLDEVVFSFVPSEDAQVIRFQSGEADVLSRFSADNFAVLQKQQLAKGYHLYDLGAGLEYNFLSLI